jgi:hypothetical protein
MMLAGGLAVTVLASTAWANEPESAETDEPESAEAMEPETADSDEPESFWAPRAPSPDIPMQPPPEPEGELEGEFQILGHPFDLGGYFWVDTGVLDRTNGQEGDPNQLTYYMNGRFVLSAQYSLSLRDWFASSRLEIMGLVNEFAKSAYEPHALDAYLRIGHKRWGDFTIGRFLGWQVYYRGQGIELFTAEEAGALDSPSIYLLDLTRGYRNEAGQAAFHLYPAEWLALEVAGVYGQENNQNNLGVRPVVVFDVAGLVLVAGMEYLHQFAINENDRVDVEYLGYGGQLRYTFGPFTLGGNGSRLEVDRIDIQGERDTSQSGTRTSFGGFLDFDQGDHSIGLAYHHTVQENERDETNAQDQLTASYLYRLPFDGLSVKAVYGYALGSLENIDANQEWENNLHSFRIRFMYLFGHSTIDRPAPLEY